MFVSPFVSTGDGYDSLLMYGCLGSLCQPEDRILETLGTTGAICCLGKVGPLGPILGIA